LWKRLWNSPEIRGLLPLGFWLDTPFSRPYYFAKKVLMALPPLELFSLTKRPPCCRAAFSLPAGRSWARERMPDSSTRRRGDREGIFAIGVVRRNTRLGLFLEKRPTWPRLRKNAVTAMRSTSLCRLLPGRNVPSRSPAQDTHCTSALKVHINCEML